MHPWNSIDFSKIDTPALVINKEMVAFNIRLAIQYAKSPDRLRPHVKTHKTLEVAKMQLAAGISKFKCATIAEAEMLAMAGAQDVLIAYPVQGPKIERVIKLIQKFSDTRYSILIENLKTAESIHTLLLRARLQIDVFIDVNNGQDRTGVSMDKVMSLWQGMQPFSTLNFTGLHCYDGHIRIPAFFERERACRQALRPVLDLKNQIEEKQNSTIQMVVGGSPSFGVHCNNMKVDCSPGTFIFWDERYHRDYREQKFKRAAVVLTRVISKLNSHTYCTDLGHKSIASEFPFPRVKFLNAPQLSQVGHSEEHLILKSELPDALEIGQLLFAYPYHICPTVALYDQIMILDQNKIIDQWEVIARNREITI